MAEIYANCEEYDKAIDELDWILGLETWVTPNLLKLESWIDPIRENPRFRAMIEKHRINPDI